MTELTLQNVKQKVTQVREFKTSDFLTDDEINEVKESNIKGKKSVGYDEIDAYIAEIIARFGYNTYIAWKNGEIDEERMIKYIQAERAREIRNRLTLESLIVSVVAGANNPTKNGHAPKSLKTAIKILKSEHKLAEGN